jgi:futalosine hydrolase
VTRRALVVVAVEAEQDAVLRGCADADVVVSGVGPAAAAAAAARALRGHDAVFSLGVGGAFGAVTGTLLGTAAVAADLGAEDGRGVVVLDLINARLPADPALLARAREALPDATMGELLTVWTVTGTAATAERLKATYPDAVGEAMEGFGVACAAQAARVPFLEVRTVSNEIGPRDRQAWDIRGALERLSAVAAAVLA